jgi:hypothetical protein
MLMRDLTQASFDAKPPLVTHYMNAHRRTLGVNVFINTKQWPRFRVFEDDLRELHIPCRDYAYTVVAMLHDWLKEKHYTSVPVNVFTGDWALKKFLKVWKSESVQTASTVDDILDSEVFIGRMYVATNLQEYARLSQVVARYRSNVSYAWYIMYKNDASLRSKFVSKAIKLLCEEYGITVDVDNYLDIVRILSS